MDVKYKKEEGTIAIKESNAEEVIISIQEPKDGLKATIDIITVVKGETHYVTIALNKEGKLEVYTH